MFPRCRRSCLGAVLGLLVAFLAHAHGEPSRIAVLIATLVLALLCVATEHLLVYLDYRIKIAEAAQRDPKLQMVQAAGDLPVPDVLANSFALKRPFELRPAPCPTGCGG